MHRMNGRINSDDWLTVAILFDDFPLDPSLYSHSPAFLSDKSSPTNDSELV